MAPRCASLRRRRRRRCPKRALTIIMILPSLSRHSPLSSLVLPPSSRLGVGVVMVAACTGSSATVAPPHPLLLSQQLQQQQQQQQHGRRPHPQPHPFCLSPLAQRTWRDVEGEGMKRSSVCWGVHSPESSSRCAMPLHPHSLHNSPRRGEVPWRTLLRPALSPRDRLHIVWEGVGVGVPPGGAAHLFYHSLPHSPLQHPPLRF